MVYQIPMQPLKVIMWQDINHPKDVHVKVKGNVQVTEH